MSDEIVFPNGLMKVETTTGVDQVVMVKWTGVNEPTVIDRIAAIDDPDAAKRVREWEDGQRGVFDWKNMTVDPPT